MEKVDMFPVSGLGSRDLGEYYTYVLNRHSQKCVTLLKLRTELKLNFSLLGAIFSTTTKFKNFKLLFILSR